MQSEKGRWEVELTGDITDVRMLAESFTGEELSVDLDGEEYVLRSTEFESQDSSACVRQRAREMADLLSGSARLVFGSREPIQVGTVYRRGPGGTQGVCVFPGTAHVLVRTHRPTIEVGHPDGTKSISRPADQMVKWVRLALHDSEVAKALRLCGPPVHEWCDLYRLDEVIRKDEYAVRQALPTKMPSKAKLEVFRRCAQDPAVAGDKARHGRWNQDPPPNPISLADAQLIVDQFLKAWLEWKASQPCAKAPPVDASGLTVGN